MIDKSKFIITMPAIKELYQALPIVESNFSLLLPALLLFVIPLYIYVSNRVLSPLARVPGPFWASLSRLWITKMSWDGQTHRDMIALHKKYGKLVRIAPGEVSVSDLEATKKIYGAGSKFWKSEWYCEYSSFLKITTFQMCYVWC